MKTYKDLAYVADGHAQQHLDLYLPEKPDGLLPLIVWIHGGGWLMGDKSQTGPLLPLVDRGYAVASINYRLSQEATFPAQIEDCKAVVRWLRANAAVYHLDPDRIGVGGDSAGGHLAALLGTTGDEVDFAGASTGSAGGQGDQSSRVQAVLDLYGPTDLTKMAGSHDGPNSPEALLLGGPVQENKDRASAANPITYISASTPPFLIIHGDQDLVVPISQSELLVAALQEAGIAVTFRPVAGAGHGGEAFFSPALLTLIEAFFEEHLRG